MTDTDRLRRKPESRPEPVPPAKPAVEIPVGLPAHSRKELLTIFRSHEDVSLRKSAGYRLYLDIADPEVQEAFLDTLTYDPVPEMRAFAAACLEHPDMSKNDSTQVYLRHAIEQDPEAKVTRRAQKALGEVTRQRKKE